MPGPSSPSATSGTGGLPTTPPSDPDLTSDEPIFVEYEYDASAYPSPTGYTEGSVDDLGMAEEEPEPLVMEAVPQGDILDPSVQFYEEYISLVDGESWPVTELDETTSLSPGQMWLINGSTISQHLSVRFPGCLDGIQMSMPTSIPNTGWVATDNDTLQDAPPAWYNQWYQNCTGSIAIWRTPIKCTYSDPDQGVEREYTAGLLGHAASRARPRTGLLPDPTVVVPSAGSDAQSYGSRYVPDPLSYHWMERDALRAKFGYQELAGGDHLQEIIHRLRESLEPILETLESGFVPRTDVIKIVPRIKIASYSYEKIIEKETKEDALIASMIGNPNARTKRMLMSTRIALSTADGFRTLVSTDKITASPFTGFGAGIGGGGGGSMTPYSPGSTGGLMPIEGATSADMIGGAIGGLSSYPGPIGGGGVYSGGGGSGMTAITPGSAMFTGGGSPY